MDRLTTDNPRGNLEVALNMFYAKDGETWVRGGGPGPEYKDVSLFSFTRNLIKAHIPGADIPDDDNELSAMMGEWLFDDVDSAEGTIATLYTAAWAYAELRHRLKAYEETGLTPEICANYKTFEDEAISKGVTFNRIVELLEADSEGRLAVSPVKPGSVVYLLPAPGLNPFSCSPQSPNKPVIEKGRVVGTSLSSSPSGGSMVIESLSVAGYVRRVRFNSFGKTVFLTRKEATAALKGGTVNGSTDV